MQAFVSANGIVHGDVACRNVLVSTEPPTRHSLRSSVTLKLADFGLSTHSTDEQYVEINTEKASNRNGMRRAAAWAAPEVLARQDFITKSDVYAFSLLFHCYNCTQ